MVEIERKFLVAGDFKPKAESSSRIVQGYICSQPGKSVRVRIRGDKGYLTIKGASDEKGMRAVMSLNGKSRWKMQNNSCRFASRVLSTRCAIYLNKANTLGKWMSSMEPMKDY